MRHSHLPSHRTADRVLNALREAGDWVEFRALADRLEIHRATLYRALAELRDLGAKIEREGAPGARGSLRLLSVPDGEEAVPYRSGLALNIAGLVLAQAGTALWVENLEQIKALAESRMTKRERRMVRALSHRLKVTGPVSDSQEPPKTVVENLLASLGGDVDTFELDFEYQKDEHAEKKLYRVVPYKLIQDTWVGGTYLLAWVPSDGSIRNFKVERMLSATASRTPQRVPDLAAIERQYKYFLGGWTSPEAPTSYEILILSPDWAHALRESEPGLPDLAFTPHADGTMTVHFKAVSDKAPLRWVLQFGPFAKVIAPPEFRERVIAALEGARSLYQNDLEGARDHESNA